MRMRLPLPKRALTSRMTPSSALACINAAAASATTGAEVGRYGGVGEGEGDGRAKPAHMPDTFCSAVASAAYSVLSLSAFDAALIAKLREGAANAEERLRDNPKASRRSTRADDAKAFILPDCRQSLCTLLTGVERAAEARLIETRSRAVPSSPVLLKPGVTA